jgi:ATP-binding cassette, subfamily B, bacterial HlyB/CyaB
MTYLATTPQAFLSEIAPFNQLSESQIASLNLQLYRYRVGQAIALRDRLPAQINIIWQGQVRALGYDPHTQAPVTLTLLEPGAIVGWTSLVREVACEAALASTEVICITLPAAEFLQLLASESAIRAYFCDRVSITELYDLLDKALQDRADSEMILKASEVEDLRALTLKILPDAIARTSSNDLDPNRVWFVSSKNSFGLELGQRLDLTAKQRLPGLRLVGVPLKCFNLDRQSTSEVRSLIDAEIPYAPVEPPELEVRSLPTQYPFVRGKGGLDSVLACFQMLSQYWQFPLRRDVVRRVLTGQRDRMGSISLMQIGVVSELVGLRAQLVKIPISAISRIQTPAIVAWRDSFAVIYEVNSFNVAISVPEQGLLQRRPVELEADLVVEESAVSVLLIQSTRDTPKKKFGLNWFLPSLKKYRGVLIEVLVASFFVQLFGLANPLMTQVIIDSVLVKNSPSTLQVLGIFLIVIAIFEAILTSLRTYLFVDTTNRIDLALGSEIIDHLLRLPLRYFDRRPVGELATRINELENIRQFLTGTALTVVLDAVFSVIYIVVMLIYSVTLTAVSLATLPLFIILTAVVSPLVRRQLRTRAEQNAQSQSYLVEVLSGIQTVKAQNIELRSRWKWQEKYTRYVSAGFKTVLTQTTASSTSTFLNQLSSLLVLWVGAYLVLAGKLSLGQLIAFRIIAGYVTSPLLRLTQLWQNFQETALSLERLSDILDTPMEVEEGDHIPLPMIEGNVQFENVSFRFNPGTPLQLDNIHLEFPAGQFVGIVGQSGSGKSTLMKLLPRLYPLESGRILMDGYDISKVDLYSLRRQVGIVPQDTLLFEGTIQENIALNHPDATYEEVIEAAGIAVAHDFIMGLPDGYNTRVGERGSALSGGQRQRIAIARTILQNPRLLILDEATSALDYNAERQVCLNLAEAFKGRTVFFITHRLSTIRNADEILLMEQGAVVEQGTHEELMEMRGRYFCLYRQQEAVS